jgi:hypothetical protein
MMNRTMRKASAVSMPAIAMLVFAVGCQDSTPQTQVSQAPPPPPPPKAPDVMSIADLMAQLNIDARVVLPEDKAPGSTAERKAVLELFDGFARGDQQVVSSYISFSDRSLLQELVTDGDWKETTDKITMIRLESGIDLEGEPCVLAVIQSGMHFQPQLWRYSSGTEKEYIFDSVYAPPDMMNKLSGTDWITAWFKLIEAEMNLAQVPDEGLVPPQQILDDNTGSGMGSAPMGDPAGSPGRGPARAPGGPTGPAVTPGRGPSGPGKR